tara:strand:- start:1054 stop:1527 length:474 start_codon:yes stop_codon:yes gene_type:complete
MKDKLQLEEVLPYLNNDVKIIINDTLYNFNGVYKSLEKEDDWVVDLDVFVCSLSDSDLKLVLKPLFDIKEFEEHIQQYYSSDLTFRYYDSGHNDLTMTITYNMMGDVFTDTLITRSDIKDSPYWFVQFLSKHHFDYRNLIGRGLAVDEKQLNKINHI